MIYRSQGAQNARLIWWITATTTQRLRGVREKHRVSITPRKTLSFSRTESRWHEKYAGRVCRYTTHRCQINTRCYRSYHYQQTNCRNDVVDCEVIATASSWHRSVDSYRLKWTWDELETQSWSERDGKNGLTKANMTAKKSLANTTHIQ